MLDRPQMNPTNQLHPDTALAPPRRTIHYLGSKTRVLPAIAQAMAEVAQPGSTVCDLFSGSAVVTRRLLDDFHVVAVDIQEYARIIASALSCHGGIPRRIGGKLAAATRSHPAVTSEAVKRLVVHEKAALDAADAGDYDGICDILESGSIRAHELEGGESPAPLVSLIEGAAVLSRGPETVLTRYYGGIYFSYEQAAELDALASRARGLDGQARDVALAAVIATASEVVSTVGNQFAQPVRPRSRDGAPKRSAITTIAARRRKPVMPLFLKWIERLVASQSPRYHCTPVRGDYRQAIYDLPEHLTAIYADPPYTRDHYSRFYHVLETIALGDEPLISRVNIHGKTRLSRGLYRDERHQSPFCIKTEAPRAFEDLFAAAEQRSIPVVLSYSPYGDGAHPRVMTIGRLEYLAGKYFSSIEIRSVGPLAHSKLNAERLSLDSSLEAELLLIGKP